MQYLLMIYNNEAGMLAAPPHCIIWLCWRPQRLLLSRQRGSEERLGCYSPLALMCVELDPHECHRHRLCLALERAGYRSFDL